jgi:hypothetical protein
VSCRKKNKGCIEEEEEELWDDKIDGKALLLAIHVKEKMSVEEEGEGEFLIKLVYIYIRIDIFTPCISVADMCSCMLRVLFDWNTVSV